LNRMDAREIDRRNPMDVAREKREEERRTGWQTKPTTGSNGEGGSK
jgi:hypothetical protein